MSDLFQSSRTYANCVVSEGVVENISEHATSHKTPAESNKAFPRHKVKRKNDQIN